jgi:hypothetical protein
MAKDIEVLIIGESEESKRAIRTIGATGVSAAMAGEAFRFLIKAMAGLEVENLRKITMPKPDLFFIDECSSMPKIVLDSCTSIEALSFQRSMDQFKEPIKVKRGKPDKPYMKFTPDPWSHRSGNKFK